MWFTSYIILLLLHLVLSIGMALDEGRFLQFPLVGLRAVEPCTLRETVGVSTEVLLGW